MSYDNRTNRFHRFLRKAFGEYPASTWTLLVILGVLVTLGIIFPPFGIGTLIVIGIIAVIIGIMWLWETIMDEWF